MDGRCRLLIHCALWLCAILLRGALAGEAFAQQPPPTQNAGKLAFRGPAEDDAANPAPPPPSRPKSPSTPARRPQGAVRPAQLEFEEEGPTVVEPLPPPTAEKDAQPFADGSGSRPSSLVTRKQAPLELVEFRGVPLSEAARLLSEQSGLKIVPSSEAAKVLVTLYLRNVKPGVAIDALTKAHGLFYREDPETDIIRIYTTKEYERDLSSFREERTEVFTLLYPNPLDVAYAISGAFGDRVRLSINGQLVDAQQMQDLVQRFSRFNLVDQQNRNLSGLTNDGGTLNGAGGGFGNGNFGNGTGIGGGGFGGSAFGGGGSFSGLGSVGGVGGAGGVNFYGGNSGGLGSNASGNQNRDSRGDAASSRLDLSADQIQALEKARASGDERLVDELLRGRRTDIFVTAVPRNNQLVVRTADMQSMQRIRDLITRLDVPTPLVLLEVQVLSLDLGDEFDSAFQFQWTDGKLTAGGWMPNTDSFTTGNILPPAADATGPSRFAPIAPGALGTQPANNMTFQIVSSNFRARLQMLETKNRVTSLATPLLLTANNEVSHIFIGKTIPIVLGFTPGTIITSNGGQTVVPPTPITVPQNIGQSMLITPNINADRTVTLRVAQENSRIDGTTTIPVPSGEIIIEESIDVVARASVTGTVVAKDGLTVAIGGLIQEDLTDKRTEVPILGKLPIVGILFRGQETGRTRTELIVMIRPYVFNTPHENAVVSHDLIQDLSLHPHAPDAVGTLNSFGPQEILTASPPQSPLQTIFRFHSLNPKIY